MVDIQATYEGGAGEREEFSVSLAWHARRQLSFIIARELSLIWQSLSRPSSLLLGTIVMPTRSIYIYDVIALINRNNEATFPPLPNNITPIRWHQRSAQTAVASGLHGTTKKPNFFFEMLCRIEWHNSHQWFKGSGGFETSDVIRPTIRCQISEDPTTPECPWSIATFKLHARQGSLS